MSVRTTNLRWAVGAFTLVVLGVMTLLLARGVPSVHALPPLGHIFYGQVTVGGNPATTGVEIQARITVDGKATNFAFSNLGDNIARTDSDGRYGFDANTFRVLADDLETETREGGRSNEVIKFFVGGDNASELAGTVLFASGQVQELNLSVSSVPAAPVIITTFSRTSNIFYSINATAIAKPPARLLLG